MGKLLSLSSLLKRLKEMEKAAVDDKFRLALAVKDHLAQYSDRELKQHYKNTALTYRYIIQQKYPHYHFAS